MFFKTLSVRDILLFLALVGSFAHQALAHDAYLQNAQDHIFSAGDKIHITVLNETDLTGDYKIDDTGIILFPLIGKVHVSEKRAPEIETLLTEILQDGYILNPIISVSLTSQNNFYILGKVKNPGRYIIPEEQLDILKAVALAGGFTSYANKKTFEIIRKKGEKKEHTRNNAADTELMSGDIIIVKGRFF